MPAHAVIKTLPLQGRQPVVEGTQVRVGAFQALQQVVRGPFPVREPGLQVGDPPPLTGHRLARHSAASLR